MLQTPESTEDASAIAVHDPGGRADRGQPPDGSFAATTHDLKNGLTAIKMTAQRLRLRMRDRRDADDASVLEALARIDRVVTDMSAQIDALGAAARRPDRTRPPSGRR